MGYGIRGSVRVLALMAVLTAVALIIFVIEAQVPLPVPVPGAKLGLANIVTLFALFMDTGGLFSRAAPGKPGAAGTAGNGDAAGNDTGGRGGTGGAETPGGADEPSLRPGMARRGRPPLSFAFMILFCRIVLGALFTGRVVAFAYSFAGGFLAFAAAAVMRRFVTDKQVWVCGAFGAVFHNTGQILAAMVITGTPAVAAYLPALTAAGIVTGVVTGLAAQLAVFRISFGAGRG